MKPMLSFKALLSCILLSFLSVAVFAVSLNQAAYKPNTAIYEFGFNSISNISITGAPADTDYSRSAMLHDGSVYRLYFFKKGTNDTLYQFGFNGTSYHYGYRSIPVLKITGAPVDADPTRIAMLHDGSKYRLYMLGKTNKTKLYQFVFNGSSYAFGFGNAIPVMNITGAPNDTDYARFAMLHDGSAFRLYFAKGKVIDKLYQFSWNGSSYAFGYNSINQLDLNLIPISSQFDVFNMLHDGRDYRFYFLAH